MRDKVSWKLDNIGVDYRDYPSLADIDGDGMQEVLTGTAKFVTGGLDGKFYVLGGLM